MANYANQTIRLQKQSLPSFPTQTSFTQLFGDTFATTEASSLYLLEDLTGTGANLTNNNGVTFPLISDLIIDLVNVGEFDGVDQYLSTPTATANEVGTGSFFASCWFKTTDTNSFKVMMQYGDEAASQANWYLRFNNDGTISAKVDDGTFVGLTITSTRTEWEDDKWHWGAILLDRDSNPNGFPDLFAIVDGEVVAEGNVGQALGSLNNADGLKLGAGNNTTPTTFFEGQLSNFQLYLDADYNLPALLEAGLRESATTTTLTLQNEASSRTNNLFFTTEITDDKYITTVINTSEGIYDLLTLFPTFPSRGIANILIDDNLVATIDQYSAGSTFNVTSEDNGIYLSAGTHILKLKQLGQNVSSSGFRIGFNFLELIKRDGGNEGDNESTSGVLFGDEILEESNFDWTLQTNATRIFNSQFIDVSLATGGEFAKGRLFMKKGLYKFTLTYTQAATRGLYTFSFGGVKVFDQLDASGSTVINQQATRFAFIEGGKMNVKFLNETSGGGSVVDITSLRFELISGRGNGDNVTGFASDSIQDIVGTSTLVADTEMRFQQRKATSAGDGQSWKFTKYFSGGTYKVQLNRTLANNNGIVDVGIDDDSTALWNQLDGYAAGTNKTTLVYTIITIPRGNHDIVFLVNGQNGSSSGFFFQMAHIMFSKITDIESDEDDNSDPVHGLEVPLAFEQSTQNGNLVLDLGGATFDRFSKIKVKIQGLNTAVTDVYLRVNGITASNYRTYTNANDAGIAALTDAESLTAFIVLKSNLMDNIRTFDVDLEFATMINDILTMKGIAYAEGEGHNTTAGHLVGTTTEINQVLLTVTAGAVATGTFIQVTGVLR